MNKSPKLDLFSSLQESFGFKFEAKNEIGWVESEVKKTRTFARWKRINRRIDPKSKLSKYQGRTSFRVDSRLQKFRRDKNAFTHSSLISVDIARKRLYEYIELNFADPLPMLQYIKFQFSKFVI